MKIPFNRPYMTGKELEYISQAYANGHLSGNGPFTKKCQEWLERTTGCAKALLTHSCTAALEMAAILIDIQPGDEIIMPSYTFVSTANAFVLRGGVPVFVDICPDTLNIDTTKTEEAITPKTKAIVPVHYAGVSCEMDTIMAIAQKHGLFVIEDAAQGVMSTYKGRYLGSIGHLGAYSFHETKNVISGEGGALIINDDQFIELAEIVWEKGTNRSKFFRGEIDKYTWEYIGSSYLPSELTAAFLYAQLEEAHNLTNRRIAIWEQYHSTLEPLEKAGILKRPHVPSDRQHNAHMYYIILSNLKIRDYLISKLKEKDINAIFHYVPLHSSQAGRKFGRTHGDLKITQDISERIIRLPMWVELTAEKVDRIVLAITEASANL
ncbi:MAG: dTDP-4-amino-4,6-dideoxygalactose transaminase [Nitrospirota bacterium]